MNWKYEVSGMGANGQTWTVIGEVANTKQGDFPYLSERAMRAVFQTLTNGKAVYGKPGVGCSGPYRVKRFLLEVQDNGHAKAEE